MDWTQLEMSDKPLGPHFTPYLKWHPGITSVAKSENDWTILLLQKVSNTWYVLLYQTTQFILRWNIVLIFEQVPLRLYHLLWIRCRTNGDFVEEDCSLSFQSVSLHWNVCVYLPNSPATSRMWYSKFLSRVKLVWILCFPSPRLVDQQRLKYPVCFTIYHSWRENRWIDTFSKDINVKWNANSLVQVLKLGHQFHFLWWSLLCYPHTPSLKCNHIVLLFFMEDVQMSRIHYFHLFKSLL